MFAVTVSPEVLEADLAAGRMCCPGCDGPLSPWGFGRVRELRMLHDVRSVRPRRACCHACQTTHVLMPAWSVPRRRDCAEVIGAALLAKAHGDGHRKIAARLGRPPATVRGWLRAFAHRADAVQARRCAGRARSTRSSPRRLGRRSPAPWTRSGSPPEPAGCTCEHGPARGSSRSRSPVACCMAGHGTRPRASHFLCKRCSECNCDSLLCQWLTVTLQCQSGGVGDAVAEVDSEGREGGAPVVGVPPFLLGAGDREVEQLAG